MSAAASPSAAAAPSAAAPSRPQLLSTPVTASARTFLTEQTGAVCKQTRAAKIFWNESVAKPTNKVARGAITETDDWPRPFRSGFRFSAGIARRSSPLEIRRVCSLCSNVSVPACARAVVVLLSARRCRRPVVGRSPAVSAADHWRSHRRCPRTLHAMSVTQTKLSCSKVDAAAGACWHAALHAPWDRGAATAIWLSEMHELPPLFI